MACQLVCVQRKQAPRPPWKQNVLFRFSPGWWFADNSIPYSYISAAPDLLGVEELDVLSLRLAHWCEWFSTERVGMSYYIFLVLAFGFCFSLVERVEGGELQDGCERWGMHRGLYDWDCTCTSSKSSFFKTMNTYHPLFAICSVMSRFGFSTRIPLEFFAFFDTTISDRMNEMSRTSSRWFGKAYGPST